MEPAPLFADVAEGPEDGEAWWLRAEDGARIRIGVWRAPRPRGTVLLLPGRTEYVEKYGRIAAGLVARGYGVVSVDWRGQGLADRLLPDRRTGHVAYFRDYQKDMRAVTVAAEALALPRPWHLIGHSMGGCIGLRALHEGLPVETAVFTGPMWSIALNPLARPLAWAITAAARPVGFGHAFAPGTVGSTYVMEVSFEENRLTRDRGGFDYMRRQIAAHPELAIGGPSMTWVSEALCEMRALRRLPAPDLPTYCALGTAERIVDVATVRAFMARWPRAVVADYEGAEHEVMMEGPAHTDRLLADITTMFGTGAVPSVRTAAPGPASAAL